MIKAQFLSYSVEDIERIQNISVLDAYVYEQQNVHAKNVYE